MSGGTLISQCNALESVNFPAINKLDGGDSWSFNSCTNLSRITLKNGVIVARVFSESSVKLTVICEEIYDKNTIDNPNNFPNKYSTFNAQELIFETLKRGIICYGGTSSSIGNTKRILLKSKGNRNDLIKIYQIDNIQASKALKDIEIEEGTRQPLVFAYFELDKDNIVNHIFKKLADNNFEDDGITPSEPIKITIGSANLNRLTDEEKAIATDKNYILA